MELIVSVGIFAIVMTVVASTYITLMSLDRQARATNQLVSSLSFAVDSMMRGIRTGTQFKCLNYADTYGNSNGTSGNCTQFSYKDSALTAAGSANNIVTFFKKTDGTIGRCESSASCTTDAQASSLTDPAITITSIVFRVRGVGPAALDEQPQVLFTVKGTLPADNRGTITSFVIEEGATQRVIDL